MARPYFKASLVEIKRLFEDEKQDVGVLRALDQELSHRNRPKAVELRNLVRGAMERVSHGEPPDNDLFAPVAVPPLTAVPGAAEVATPYIASPKKRGQEALFTEDAAPHHEPKKAKRHTAISEPGTPGLPKAYEPKQRNRENQIELENTDDLRAVFIKVLDINVEELRRKERGRALHLHDGTKDGAAGERQLYRFPLSEEVILPEDSPVKLRVGADWVEAEVVSMLGDEIRIAVAQDFGDTIDEAELLSDQTQLLSRLRDRLEAVKSGNFEGFNDDSAERAFGRKTPNVGLALEVDLSDMEANANEDQLRAVRKALGSDLLFLWGPPGTGKSTVTGRIVIEMMARGDRVLVVSNTNLAVDSLVFKVCQELEKTSPEQLADGAVLRLGDIHMDDLRQQFGDAVNVELVAEEKSEDLRDERGELQVQVGELNTRMTPLRDRLEMFEFLRAKEPRRKHLLAQLARDREMVSEWDQRAPVLVATLERLRADFVTAEQTGMIKRLITGISPGEIRGSIRKNEKELQEIREWAPPVRQRIAEIEVELPKLEAALSVARRKTEGHDERKTKTALEALEDDLKPVVQRIADIEAELDDIEAQVLAACRVLGMTATKAMMRAKDLTDFDTVVVDEASMLTLPMAYLVAGLAGKTVVLSGDYRQLPPIVQTDQDCVEEWMGRDIFEASGVKAKKDAGQDPSEMVMLRTQYRMTPEVCDLISKPFYQRELRTGRERGTGDNKAAPEPFEGPLTIIDTGDQGPFSNTRPGTFSRYNIVHAAVVRALGRYCLDHGFGEDLRDVGVCTPYAAQKDLIQSLLEGGDAAQISVGTVHRFQGSEKKLMIYDTVDSPGIWPPLSHFVNAHDIDASGAKLMNVAVSRAENHLVVIANLDHMEHYLPGSAFLRGILHDMQQRGRVISSGQFLEQFSSQEVQTSHAAAPSRGLSPVAPSGVEFVRGEQVDDRLLRDMENARESIVVFSAFMTQRRVGQLETVFGQKILSGVKVRCITLPPDKQGQIDPDNVMGAVEKLRSMGVVVDFRFSMHEKMILIDGRVGWMGSLNPLSFGGRTGEIMMRLENAEAVKEMARLMASRPIGKKQAGDALRLLIEGEGRMCPDGHGSMGLHPHSRYGPYFECVVCGHSENSGHGPGSRKPPRKPKLKGVASPSAEGASEDAPQCPTCGDTMVMRNGRNGPFWGCSNYPSCKGTLASVVP